MKRHLSANYLVIAIACILFSCKGRMYKAQSNSMAATIQQGEPFYVKEVQHFQKNDIVVFNYYGNDYQSQPDDNGNFKQHWERRVFRLIAVSGDTIQIMDGDVFVNKKEVPLPPGAKISYRIYSQVDIDEFANNFEKSGDTITYIINLTRDEVIEYEQRNPPIIKIKKWNFEPSMPDTIYARTSANENWNTSDYGPLRIPLPGETVEVNDNNFRLYRNIPGIKKGKNVIAETLYFVMGDNRYEAEDSRFIGLISHSNMYGVVK